MAARPKKQKTAGRLGRVAFAVLVVLAVLALAFFLVLRTQDQTSIAENGVGSILSPVQRAFSGMTLYLRDLFSGVKDYQRMGQDLEVAERELTDLRLRVMSNQEAILENERLKALLEVKERFQALDPLYAKVITRSPGVWFSTFSINMGEAAGVRKNMAVMTGDGLVGVVFETGLNYAKVRTLVDPSSRVGCLIERTRNPGVMFGPIDAYADTIQCRMEYVPVINDVTSGDVVITSGDDGLFPKGLKVGTVTQVARQQSDASDRFIYVMPSVNFHSIEEVVVLRVIPETDDDRPMPVLPTPTPRPTPTLGPTPVPTPNNEVTTGLDETFTYPEEGELDEEGNLINEPTRAPVSDQGQTPDDNNMLPEDYWAQ